MIKNKKFLTTIMVGLLTFASFTLPVSAAWVDTPNGRQYTQTASPGYVTGLKTIGDFTYFFDSKGIMQTGFQVVSEKLCYFNEKGQMVKGSFTAEGKKFYADKNGVLVLDQWVGDYFYQIDGTMAVNTWVDGKWVGADGKFTGKTANIGWITKGGNTYYYDQNQNIMKGWVTVDGFTYYLHPSTGVLQKGILNIGGNTYFAEPIKGAIVKSQWLENCYATSSGALAKGLTTISGKIYYFDPNNGALQKGWIKSAGKIYYAKKEDGAIRNDGWILSKKYYASPSGALLTGLNSVGGKLYYFDESTGLKVTTEKVKVGSDCYYFQKDGSAIKDSWVQIGSYYYYFMSDGKMARSTWIGEYYVSAAGKRTTYSKQTGWVTVGGDKYYYDSNGKEVTGLQTISGATYYFDSTGRMMTGIQTVDGKKYYFQPSGQMAVSTTIVIGSKQYTINESGIVIKEDSIKIDETNIGSKIVNYAIQYIGGPYVYGGTSLTNGADCSGFVMSVFDAFGIKLLRVADDQMHGPNSTQISQGYKEPVFVDTASMQPGDLIFYGSGNYASHVGIYIGNGEIVHASNSQPYPRGGIKISKYDYSTPIRVVRYWS